MQRVNEPNISVAKKTTEQNMEAAKISLAEHTDAINVLFNYISSIESRLDALESEDE